jgi:hypothetical protein
MPIAVKILLQMLVLLVACYAVTESTSLINKPSDILVTVGCFGIAVALIVLWYGTKFIWKKSVEDTINKLNNYEGDR